jgi:putative Mg2+ transporter-C (MgtC) family protein
MNWSTDFQPLLLVIIAAGVGGIVGLEREIQRKSAGLRTHIFVSAGAALLMVSGHAVIASYEQQGTEIVRSDPLRMMQAIIVGISFLGAGTIIHDGGKDIEGLTTAASIFLTAGIGMAIAVEEYVLAIGTALFTVLTLAIIGRIEKYLPNHETDERNSP